MAMLATGLIPHAATAHPATGSRRPNILWLVSEDNGPFIGAYGDRLAHTPVIDSLARRGLLYRHAYSNAPVCSVSRFGILTGAYPESCGAAQNHRVRIRHPAALRGYPAYLREAGYYCVNNAKTDYNTDIDPNVLWNESSATAHWRNRPVGSPFMAVFNFLTTHSSSVFERTEGKVQPADVNVPAYLPDTQPVRVDIASYYNKIEIMDAELGARLSELESDGLLEDTIIFYFSDHGGVMPRSKQFCYEAGLHVPLIVAFPPRFAHLAPAPMGTQIEAVVSHIDLAPTVLSLAGIAKPAEMVGTPFLGERTKSAPRYAFACRNRLDERIDFTRTVTDGRYRYLRNYMPHRPWALHDGFMWYARSWQEWERLYLSGRLNGIQSRFFGPKEDEELYDVVSDPDQAENLVNDRKHAGKLAELRTVLDQHLLTINDNGFIPEGSPLEGYEESRVAGAYPLRRIMTIAAAAARRDTSQVDVFKAGLADDNEAVRYWCAQGLVMLGRNAQPACDALVRTLDEDISPSVRIVAAEALAALGQQDVAVTLLVKLLDLHPALAIKQQALNALNTLVCDSSFHMAVPSLERWASVEQRDVGMNFDYWTVRSLSLYLIAVSKGTYKPDYITFSID